MNFEPWTRLKIEIDYHKDWHFHQELGGLLIWNMKYDSFSSDLFFIGTHYCVKKAPCNNANFGGW
jgi:hypothetical protein